MNDVLTHILIGFVLGVIFTLGMTGDRRRYTPPETPTVVMMAPQRPETLEDGGCLTTLVVFILVAVVVVLAFMWLGG